MSDKENSTSVKILKSYRLSSGTIEYVEAFAKLSGISSTKALERIIYEHEQCDGNYMDTLADTVVRKFNDRYENLFTRLRLGVNFSDQNIQILLELMNSIICNLDLKQTFLSDNIKSDILEQSEQSVKKRISRYKQMNDDKAKK